MRRCLQRLYTIILGFCRSVVPPQPSPDPAKGLLRNPQEGGNVTQLRSLKNIWIIVHQCVVSILRTLELDTVDKFCQFLGQLKHRVEGKFGQVVVFVQHHLHIGVFQRIDY